jgi:tRNA (guanine-N7-)-methyltransferase
MNEVPTQHLRHIRSFVPRQGRITAGQLFALQHYWPLYGLEVNQRYDFNEVFGCPAPLIVEIGFGNGQTLANMALSNPNNHYIGIEVHRPGVGQLLMQIEQHKLGNVRVYNHDALDILEHHIPDASLQGVHLFFPDPWPKARHHKRRLVQTSFMALLAQKIQIGGYFHAATDWQPYAEVMLETLTAAPGFKNQSPTNEYCQRPDYRPLTKFEQRGLNLGHGVWDLIFIRQ